MSYEYQVATRATAVYPGAMSGNKDALMYLALGLASEGGEVAGKLKKVVRGDYDQPVRAFDRRDQTFRLPTEVREAVLAEIGDVLYYVARLADELGTDLPTVMAENLEKLLDRKARGVLQGNGDNR